VIILWHTTFIKKIFRANPIKIILKSFTQSQKLARNRYFGLLIMCTNNTYRGT
jgi:hypothetical protein